MHFQHKEIKPIPYEFGRSSERRNNPWDLGSCIYALLKRVWIVLYFRVKAENSCWISNFLIFYSSGEKAAARSHPRNEFVMNYSGRNAEGCGKTARCLPGPRVSLPLQHLTGIPGATLGSKTLKAKALRGLTPSSSSVCQHF